MLTLRALQWPDDRAGLLALDTAFSTDRIYHVMEGDRSFALAAVSVTPPLRKDYPLANDVDTLPTFAAVIVAAVDAQLVGLAALQVEAWNRRARLDHCYVAPAVRGQGVGRALIDAVVAHADALAARCVWLETQNINYPAIQFYERVGFVWCGLDTALYERHAAAGEEIALFFVRQLA